MKRKSTLVLFCAVALVAILAFTQPITASADMGPKPSLNVTFVNLGDEACYVTILSEHITTGPYSAYAPDEGWDYKELGHFDSNYYYDDDYHNEEVERIWQTFVDYKDADGYYFLQLWWKLDAENIDIRWGYFPPYSFKVLLYYPESDVFVSSKIYERYAFNSYYTVDMSAVNDALLNPDLSAGDEPLDPGFTLVEVELELKDSYDYASEILWLLLRIALTILIELAIALLFRIKGRKSLIIILVTNVVTQIALNVALNVLCYFDGLWILLLYLPLELGVIFVEAVTYAIALRKQGVPIWKSIVYALVANQASGLLGFVFMFFLPGLF